ncbi:MAG: transcription elongation factor GreA [Chloroflexota bacterium]
MAAKPVFLTPEGRARLEEELNHLRTVKRRKVAERIHQAKESGDITDNAEYDDAKNEQAIVEHRILTIERLLQNAVLIDNNSHATDSVRLGSKVTVSDSEGGESTYTIVGSAEANPGDGKISNESPVGQALLGRKVGDHVVVHVPAGMLSLTVVAIG